MKTFGKLFLISAILLSGATVASGQLLRGSEPAPAGAVIYSLPSTTITLEVTAEHESFVAGPYAAFAQKYLGIEARSTSGDTYTIHSVEMRPYVEADPQLSVAINLSASKNGAASFLSLCSQGLVIASESYTGEPVAWRFPAQLDRSVFDKAGATQNLDSRTTTLYKTVQTAQGLEKVPVQQSQIVEKSIEKKAEQTASLIFKLRQTRIDIITGNTDATYSGEAMHAALKEIDRLENEYMSLFVGKKKIEKQKAVFDVVPSLDNNNQMYIAFRISDTQGLLPAQNMSGRPIVLELVSTGAPVQSLPVDGSAKDRIYYRKPVTVTARLLDGQKELMQGRIPVYQFGKVVSVPLSIAIK